jgi:hypothetical protein
MKESVYYVFDSVNNMFEKREDRANSWQYIQEIVKITYLLEEYDISCKVVNSFDIKIVS